MENQPDSQQDRSDIITDFIAKLPSPSPAFRIWIADAYSTGRLELIIDGIISAGHAKTVEEALQYLKQKSNNLSLKELLLTVSDFWGGSRQKVRKWRLKKVLQQVKGENNGENGLSWDIARFHGTIGHLAIPELLTGRLPQTSTLKSTPQLCFPDGNQVIPWKDIFSQEILQTQINITALKRAWQSLLPLANDDFETLAPSKIKELNKLYNILSQIFGEYAERLKKGFSRDTAFLYFLTMMSWATAVMYFKKEKKQILFQEIPVIAKRFGLSGGRTDALRIDKQNLSLKQRKLLEEIVKERYELRKRFKIAHPRILREDHNIGDFFHQLKHRLGQGELKPTIIDWKFAVGDGSSKLIVVNGQKVRQYNIITYDQIKDKPLESHLSQLKRYLALANLDYHCILREEGVKTHWPDDVYFPEGEIIYFLPTTLPVVHKIANTPENQQTFFGEEVVNRWSLAEIRRAVRGFDNVIIGDLVRDLKNKTPKNQKNRKAPENHKPGQMLLLSSPATKVPSVIDEMVDKERKFLDPHQIIEITGKRKKDGETTYKMHLDRLITALAEKKVANHDFQPKTGGFIHCFLPEHHDRSASFHINPGKGIFKCFGKCGVGGIILPTSIPEDLSLPVHLTKWSQQAYNQTIIYKPPSDQHIRIMAMAQRILQDSFRNSPGEEYLVRERCLDPDLALEKGIGFGKDALIEGLLDSGFTLEELIFYGFVGFSNSFGHFADISAIIEKRGLSVVDNRGKKGYPCSVLHDRITFPLSLFGKINNFYGRIIHNTDKRFFHRKLTIDHTGVAHGGFNMEVLDDPKVKEVYPVEGCCDALALIQMTGCNAAIGMIGVDNWIIIETLARSDKKIAVALDYDETGKAKTWGYYIERKGVGREWKPGLLEKLEKKGKNPKDLRDYTAEYVASHPEIQEIIRESKVDWNDWLIELVRNGHQLIKKGA